MHHIGFHHRRCHAVGEWCLRCLQTETHTIRFVIIIIIIIITRPKPAYGRQGLAGSLGQDTNQAGMFWGVLNVSLRASGAQLRYKLTWNHKNQPEIMRSLESLTRNLENHETDLEP